MKSVTQALARWARWFGVARAVCIVLLFALIPLRVIDPPPLQEVRLRSFDLFQVLRPREQQALSPVVIVDIDEASLKEIGQWPWPRTVVADLVSKLKDRGAVAIGFDIIFAEPDRMSPAVAVESFRGLDDETRSKLASLPSNDEVLADAMKRARVIVGQSGSPLSQPRSDAEKALQTGFAIIGPDPTPLLVTFKGLLRNVPLIEQAAAGRGVLSIDPDRDGIIRRVPVILTAQDVLVPSLAMESRCAPTKRVSNRSGYAGWRYRPTIAAGSGCISTRSTASAPTSRPRTCCKAGSRPTGSAAGWCWSAPRPSACSTSRPPRSMRRCPASKCTPRFSKAC